MKKILILLAFWVCWGFGIGTFILLVPLRKTVDHARSNGWSEFSENAIVFLLIVLIGVVSFFLARYTTSRVKNTYTGNSTKAIHTLIPVLAAVIALYIMMNPSVSNTATANTEVSTNFTIGSYPDANKIQDLKNQGYTAIITLLHPAVVPFEPKLLAEEKDAAKKSNLSIISIPMLPWISENEAAIDSLRNIVRTAKGNYYIHCYIGKDRVNVARRIIEQETTDKVLYEHGMPQRSIDDIKAFERGNIYRLEEGIYLTPQPTDEEYFGYVLATDFKQIVSLGNMEDKSAADYAVVEEKFLRNYSIAYTVFNVPDDVSQERMTRIADSVRSMKKPVLIHAFRSDNPVAQLFMKTYRR